MSKLTFMKQVELDICRSLLKIPNPNSTVEPNGTLGWRYKGDANLINMPSDYSNPCLEISIEPMKDSLLFKLKPLGDFMDCVAESKRGKLVYPKIAVPVIADSNDLVAEDAEIRKRLIGDLL